MHLSFFFYQTLRKEPLVVFVDLVLHSIEVDQCSLDVVLDDEFLLLLSLPTQLSTFLPNDHQQILLDLRLLILQTFFY